MSMETVQNIQYAINFTFTAFNLQPKLNGECVDYVQFWDGGYENLGKAEHQLTEKLCGASLESIPQSIAGKSMKMLLLFHTDGSIQSTGFKAEYNRLLSETSSPISGTQQGKNFSNIYFNQRTIPKYKHRVILKIGHLYLYSMKSKNIF